MLQICTCRRSNSWRADGSFGVQSGELGLKLCLRHIIECLILFFGEDFEQLLAALGVLTGGLCFSLIRQLDRDDMLDDLDLIGKFILLGGLGAQQGFLAGGLEFFIKGLEDAVKVLNAQIPEIFGADPALEGETYLLRVAISNSSIVVTSFLCLNYDLEHALGLAFNFDDKGIVTGGGETDAGELVIDRLHGHLRAEGFKDALVGQQLLLDKFIVEAVELVRILAALEHEEIMAIADTGLFVPIVGGVHGNADRGKLIRADVPNIAAGDIALEFILDGELAVLESDGGHRDIRAGRNRVAVFILMDLTVGLDLSDKAVVSGAAGKAADIEFILTISHLLQHGPGDIFNGRNIFAGTRNINIQIAAGKTTAIGIPDIINRGATVCIFIRTVPVIRFIVPLDGEAEHTIDLSACPLDILADIGISQIARVGPCESVIPFEHRFGVGIDRGGQRDHVLGEAVFHEQLQLLGDGQDIRDEFINTDLLYMGESFRVNGNLLFHSGKGICDCTVHTGHGVAVGKEDIVDADVIETGKAAGQGIHIAEFRNGFLGVLKHFVLVKIAWGAYSWRGRHTLIGGDGSVDILAFRQVNEQCADAGIADAGESRIH